MRCRKKGERSEPRDEDTAFGGTADPKPATRSGAGCKPRKQPLPRSQKALLCLMMLLAVALACSVLEASRCDTQARQNQANHMPDQPWGMPWATINKAGVPAYAAPAEAGTVVRRLGQGIAVEVISLRGGWAEVLRWTSPDPLWVRVEYLDFAWTSTP